MATSIATGIDDLLCFATFYFYDPYSNANVLVFKLRKYMPGLLKLDWGMCVCMYACLHVCVSACMRVCMYACLHVCVSACMRVCMYACLSTHPHEQTSFKPQKTSLPFYEHRLFMDCIEG